MSRLSLYALVLMCIMMTAACNTVEGVGEDMQSGGRKLERAAEKSH